MGSDIRKQWSVAQEKLLQDLAQRCQSRSVMHGMDYRAYKRMNTLITVPSIVITLFGGAASTSQRSLIDLFGQSSEQYVPLVIGVMSMIVSIMNSISSFMKIPTLTEQHLQAHISFGKLTRKISSDIQVSPLDRSMTGREACKKYEEMFVALMDIAPPVSKGTERRFSGRSDVKALNMSVPPLVKMSIVKTFTQLEAERVAETEKMKARLESEIAQMSVQPKLERRSSIFKGLGGKREQPVTIEMPIVKKMSDFVPPASVPPLIEGSRVARRGKKKMRLELQKELSDIRQERRVSRLASNGLLDGNSSDSSSESQVRSNEDDNSLEE